MGDRPGLRVPAPPRGGEAIGRCAILPPRPVRSAAGGCCAAADGAPSRCSVIALSRWRPGWSMTISPCRSAEIRRCCARVPAGRGRRRCCMPLRCRSAWGRAGDTAGERDRSVLGAPPITSHGSTGSVAKDPQCSATSPEHGSRPHLQCHAGGVGGRPHGSFGWGSAGRPAPQPDGETRSFDGRGTDGVGLGKGAT